MIFINIYTCVSVGMCASVRMGEETGREVEQERERERKGVGEG